MNRFNPFVPSMLWMAFLGMGVLPLGCHRNSESAVDAPVTDVEGCASAIPVMFQDGVFIHDGTVSNVADAAYFSVSSQQVGDWLLLATANAALTGGTFDPVIFILDENGEEVLAAVDQMALWASEDPYFYYHFASAAPVCVKVESYTRWTNSFAGADTDAVQLRYHLELQLNPGEIDVYAPASGSGETPAAGAPFSFTPSEDYDDLGFKWLHGVLDAEGDLDDFAFTSMDIATLTNIYVDTLTGHGDPYGGVSGMGSTAQIALQLLDSNNQVVAELVPDALRTVLTAALAPNETYVVRVSRAPGWAPGANDFYNLYMVSETVASFSAEGTGPNDTMESATSIEMTLSDSAYYLGTLFGQLETETDVDFYKLSLSPGQSLMLQCLGASAGSGLQNLTIGALDENGTLVQEDIEMESPIEWSDGPYATKGALIENIWEDVYLRITGSYNSSAQSRLYQCYVLVMDN